MEAATRPRLLREKRGASRWRIPPVRDGRRARGPLPSKNDPDRSRREGGGPTVQGRFSGGNETERLRPFVPSSGYVRGRKGPVDSDAGLGNPLGRAVHRNEDPAHPARGHGVCRRKPQSWPRTRAELEAQRDVQSVRGPQGRPQAPMEPLGLRRSELHGVVRGEPPCGDASLSPCNIGLHLSRYPSSGSTVSPTSNDGRWSHVRLK